MNVNSITHESLSTDSILTVGSQANVTFASFKVLSYLSFIAISHASMKSVSTPTFLI